MKTLMILFIYLLKHLKRIKFLPLILSLPKYFTAYLFPLYEFKGEKNGFIIRKPQEPEKIKEY
jgi:hypothetical protein